MSYWDSVLKVVTTPLAWFGLAGLILLGISIGVLSQSWSYSQTLWALGLILFIFTVLLVMVFLLTWFRPHHLTFSQAGHLVKNGMKAWGTSKDPKRWKDIADQKPERLPQPAPPGPGKE